MDEGACQGRTLLRDWTQGALQSEQFTESSAYRTAAGSLKAMTPECWPLEGEVQKIRACYCHSGSNM